MTFLVRVTFTATISVTYKTIPFLVLYSITGTLFLLYVSKKINRNSLLEFWGKNSLVVYALHFLPLYLSFKYLYLMLQPTSISRFVIFIILLFLSTYTICYLFILVFRYKPFKFLLGKF